MKVQLLGTGSADGWPNPWCTCASCATLRGRGEVRGQTSALVDDTLLIDCGPEAPRAALRHGADLTAVRTLLFSHAHPDHVGPMALLWRQWVAGAGPLEVAGPAAVLDLCRPWVGPTDPVTFTALTAGDVVTLASGHVVTAYKAQHGAAIGDDTIGEALLYGVDDHLLWATDTGPFQPPATAYALVLLECTSSGHPGHLSLETFRAQAGALGGRVVAVHLGHGNPPDVARVLAGLAEVHPDGAVLGDVRHVLVTGGARSGKSGFAEGLLAGREVDYVATSGLRDGDAEWALRVSAHRASRPGHWRTLETCDLLPLLTTPGPALLVEDATLWLTDVMDGLGWDAGDPADACRAFAEALAGSPRDVVVVTNEVGSGVVPEHASGRRFRDDLGRLNQLLAAACDEAYLVVAGRPLRL